MKIISKYVVVLSGWATLPGVHNEVHPFSEIEAAREFIKNNKNRECATLYQFVEKEELSGPKF